MARKPTTRITKSTAERFLGDVPAEHVFWCRDGRTLKNLRELQEALITMSDDTFNYHSNDEKTDFSNWVRDVIGDEKLARDLERIPSRTLAAKIVEDRVNLLNSKLASGI